MITKAGTSWYLEVSSSRHSLVGLQEECGHHHESRKGHHDSVGKVVQGEEEGEMCDGKEQRGGNVPVTHNTTKSKELQSQTLEIV